MVTRLYFLLAMAIGGFALRYFFEQPYVDHVAPMVLVKERPVHYTKSRIKWTNIK